MNFYDMFSFGIRKDAERKRQKDRERALRRSIMSGLSSCDVRSARSHSPRTSRPISRASSSCGDLNGWVGSSMGPSSSMRDLHSMGVPTVWETSMITPRFGVKTNSSKSSSKGGNSSRGRSSPASGCRSEAAISEADDTDSEPFGHSPCQSVADPYQERDFGHSPCQSVVECPYPTLAEYIEAVPVGSESQAALGRVWSDNTLACSKCNAFFGAFRRRHHCRSCGSCVCHDCSPYQVILPDPLPHPEKGTAGPHRLCLTCYDSQQVRRSLA